MKPQRLTGKCALITGGAAGIGAAKLINGYIVPPSGGRECGSNIHVPVSWANPHS